jgi:hypothetical protein
MSMGAVLHPATPKIENRDIGPTVVASRQNGLVRMATGRLIWHGTTAHACRVKGIVCSYTYAPSLCG